MNFWLARPLRTCDSRRVPLSGEPFLMPTQAGLGVDELRDGTAGSEARLPLLGLQADVRLLGHPDAGGSRRRREAG
ncbi:hypothetical protein Psi01_65140 [Planobispora siamensis]|uniref:Uncharacterized protein n=1 Tax=Planobispora siamensis TaxID=936338 RepID=A0A8J3WM03_9ACTN|nr:hypothetical protein Psi01_65140 [Planobispora siamensis]